jgi:uncharacterized protein (DUF305 family)
MASTMADEAIAKAVHTEPRAMARRMKVEQNWEIAQYKVIRQQLLGSKDTPGPMVMQPIPAARLRSAVAPDDDRAPSWCH